MSKINVKDKPNLMRDTHSKAVVNVNKIAYERSIKIRLEAQKQRDAIRNATREINNIKCEMHEIKDMLKILMDRK